jgi:predicted ATP-dependent serine protease
VGLLGEVRRTSGEERRTKEAKRLGFTSIIAPQSTRNLNFAAKLLG